MEWWQWLVGILLFIISLSVLVAIHELGHFATAKMFRVFCFDYSIGFGPKLFQYKRKEGETTFTIRGIPLGGFVSMYAEGVELEGKYVAPNRNLEGIGRRKRAVVFSAGIILNFVLGFLLIFISNQCFSHPYTVGRNKTNTSVGIEMAIREDSTIYSKGIRSGDLLILIHDPTINGFILDDNIVMNKDGKDYHYVLCMPSSPSTDQYDPFISDEMRLYVGQAPSEAQKALGLEYAPDLNSLYAPEKGHSFETTLSFYTKESGYDKENVKDATFTVTASETEKKWEDFGLNLKIYRQWYSFPQAISKTWDDFVYANTSIAKAIGGLFTGSSWSDIGGPVAILTQTTTVFSSYGMGMYIYYWGFISCNLALFNLLPFPGLDGWSLLVLAIEGVTRKKINTKVKNIISFVGLMALFALMGLVLIKDFIGLF